MKSSPKPDPDRQSRPSPPESAPAPEPEWIDQPEKLREAARVWQDSPVIGLDTEFVRERTYFARPGLVQISDGNRAWLLDAVSMDNFDPLAALLDDTATTKVLHSVGEDLEILFGLAQTLPRPLFDTQIAAAMTGQPLQRRYEDLVGDKLGIALAGGKARSDWTRRPLAGDLLTYAAQDVLWLPALHETLSAELEAAERLDWLREDCHRLVDSARTSPEPDQAYLRIKGAARLTDVQLQRLKRLATWREQQAIDQDRPRGFILKDPVMLTLATHPPDDPSGLAETRDLPRPVARRFGQQLIELLHLPPDEDFQRPEELKPLTTDQREQLDSVQTRVREAAAELGLDPALVASKRLLIRWIQTGNGPVQEGWRKALLEQEH